MKRLLAIVLIHMLYLNLYAEPTTVPGNIKGKVIDANTHEALDYVNVSVKRLDHDEPLKGSVTDKTGLFIIGNLKDGSYEITVSYMGYRTYQKKFSISKSNENINLHLIRLTEDSQVLNEVEIVAQQSQMRFEIDKKVFNVGQDISSAGGSASDVLTNIPSVEVDNEGEVSLRGNSSVTVWINGKASGISADNRAQILEQMPAESIEKIEVITNPSAKYSPEGTAGIINIVLKQDRKAGYFGSVQAGADTKGGYNASGNINYSSKKLDAYASLGYRERKHDGGGYSYRTNLRPDGENTFLNQESTSKSNGGNIFARLGLTYHLTTKDHLSVSGFGMFSKRTPQSTIRYTSNVPGSFLNSCRYSAQDVHMNGGNVELGYKHDFSKTSNLDFTVSYNNWSMNRSTDYTQESNYADESEYRSFQRQKNRMQSHNWETQLDYINAFNKNHKIEAGYKGTFSRESSPVNTFNKPMENAEWIEDQLLYNHFMYNKDIHALYTSYSGKINNFGFQLGLRGEYSHISTRSLAYGEQKQDIKPFNNSYFNLFPSVFLSYTLPKNNEVQLNYTRRISRPWGGQLNSFVNISDSANISFGNPYLTPEYSNAFEINYIKTWENHTLSFSGYYRSTDDVIQRIRFLDGNVMKTTHENVAQQRSTGLEVVSKNSLFKFLNLTTTLNFFHAKLDGFSYLPPQATEPVIGKSQSDFSWNARVMANLMLPYAISLQVTGNYNSRRLVAQGHREPNYSLDAGLRKSFFNRKLSVSINARDILDSRKWHTITSGAEFKQDSKNWGGGRQFGLTLTYSFGNMRAKAKPMKRNEMESSPIDSDYGDE